MLHEERRIGFGSGPIDTGNRAAALSRVEEEPIFFDEPAGASAPLRIPDTSSAFEIFPDEEYGKDPVARTKSDRSPIRLFEVRKVVTGARIIDEVATIGRVRPGLLLLFFLAAALAAFGTVRACQVNGISSVTLWQLVGR
jgi:hypothetical protein